MLNIIAEVTVDPALLQDITEQMKILVANTRGEAGCIDYDLYQNNESPNRLTFVEKWESRELWRKHMDGDAIKSFNSKISGGIIHFSLQEMSLVV